jgi:hypothetical protein
MSEVNNMANWKKTFGIHLCCSVLVLAFLIAVPIVATTAAGEAVTEAVSESSSQKDPLGRLPSSPEEAQQRLEERDIAWPESTAGDEYEAAAVIEGVQSGVRVALLYDSVEGFITHGGANVKVELWRGGAPQGNVVEKALASGWFKADLSAIAGGIQSGDVVRVTDLGDASSVDIDCTLNANIDFGNNRVTGTTVGGNTVDVYIVAPSTYYADIPPGAAHAQTTALGSGGFNAPIADLDVRLGDAAYVISTDAKGHRVLGGAVGSGDGLVVYPQYDDVMGYYTPYTALQVKAGTATKNVTSMKDGFFEAWFQNYDIADGTKVSCNMGGAREVIVRDVTAKCDPATNKVGITAPAGTDVRLTMDPYGDPVIYQIAGGENTGNIEVALGAAFTATGTEVYNVTWYDADGDAVVYEFQTFSWYLAEGATAGGFETWVLVQNPNDFEAEVVLTYMTDQGEVPGPSMTLAPNSRHTWFVGDTVTTYDVSTMVTSTTGAWIIAERAQYFDYVNTEGYHWQGGHDSIGTIAPCETWYLAEGATLGGFETWVLVQNPNDVPADVTLTYMTDQGEVPGPSMTLAPNSRHTWFVGDTVTTYDVSTMVTSDQKVVAERAQYFDYVNTEGYHWQGGHDSIGTTTPADTWYLAEGATAGGFETWVLVQNPNDVPADVTLTYMTDQGGMPGPSMTLAPNSRHTWFVGDTVTTYDVSTKVTSNMPVVAERAEYFTYYNGIKGGHDSIGTTTPADTWYLAEGATAGGFETWVLVQNPNDVPADVTLTFMTDQGELPGPTETLAPNSRHTWFVGNYVITYDVSTRVTSDMPVVAERAEYFDYVNTQGYHWQGGHDSIGVPNILGW